MQVPEYYLPKPVEPEDDDVVHVTLAGVGWTKFEAFIVDWEVIMTRNTQYKLEGGMDWDNNVRNHFQSFKLNCQRSQRTRKEFVLFCGHRAAILGLEVWFSDEDPSDADALEVN
jgi:hypothetical protein